MARNPYRIQEGFSSGRGLAGPRRQKRRDMFAGLAGVSPMGSNMPLGIPAASGALGLGYDQARAEQIRKMRSPGLQAGVERMQRPVEQAGARSQSRGMALGGDAGSRTSLPSLSTTGATYDTTTRPGLVLTPEEAEALRSMPAPSPSPTMTPEPSLPPLDIMDPSNMPPGAARQAAMSRAQGMDRPLGRNVTGDAPTQPITPAPGTGPASTARA